MDIMSYTRVVVAGRHHLPVQEFPAAAAAIDKALVAVNRVCGPLLLIHGGSADRSDAIKGTDAVVARWAQSHGYPTAEVRNIWPKFGKSARLIHNRWLLALHPHLVVVMPGASPDLQRQAAHAGIPVVAAYTLSAESGDTFLRAVQDVVATASASSSQATPLDDDVVTHEDEPHDPVECGACFHPADKIVPGRRAAGSLRGLVYHWYDRARQAIVG